MVDNFGREEPNVPQVVTNHPKLMELVRQAREAGRSIGLVPTMGALHEGHLSLVRRSVSRGDFVVVTIFVNPTQFGPHEDFAKYPRTLESDVAILAEARADLVFAPAADQIYRPGFSTYVEPPEVAHPLEGRCRPGHFRGVATIVLKLFHLVPADVAYFGQKDFQQTRVIETMVEDLDVPIRIEVCPTVREVDGLAMSSRNRYLNSAERQQSLAVSRSLARASALFRDGQRDAEILRAAMEQVLAEAHITRIDYAAIVDPRTLTPVANADSNSMALIAAFVGGTRLIDNCRLGEG
jgi:pantoate--beta-alanine ligase